jgi:hypothetical protein
MKVYTVDKFIKRLVAEEVVFSELITVSAKKVLLGKLKKLQLDESAVTDFVNWLKNAQNAWMKFQPNMDQVARKFDDWFTQCQMQKAKNASNEVTLENKR